MEESKSKKEQELDTLCRKAGHYFSKMVFWGVLYVILVTCPKEAFLEVVPTYVIHFSVSWPLFFAVYYLFAFAKNLYNADELDEELKKMK